MSTPTPLPSTMKITIFGTGYVGLVQGAVLAGAGHHVLNVDIDEKKIENLRKGIVPIYEPGLETLVSQAQHQGFLEFTTDFKKAVDFADILFIAVGTPPGEDGSADLTHVLKVAHSIGQNMQSDKLVVNKSTVPVGTADKVKAEIEQCLNTRQSNLQVEVASNPEFLKEGCAVQDATRPDRIIIGVNSEQAERTLREVYAPFNRNHDKIICMDIRSAELTKYAANCMLATKISFMNEMALLAEHLGADIEAVRKGIGSDPRIGYHFIYPGPGYGGSCFPKDVQALARTAQALALEPVILQAVETRNQRQKQVLMEKLERHFSGELSGKTIAVWGLSFKPNTDDLREAPAVELVKALWKKGAKTHLTDPKAAHEFQAQHGAHPLCQFFDKHEEGAIGADAVVLVTEWKVFNSPDWESLAQQMNTKVVVDGRNLYNPQHLRALGFTYYGIGRS